MAGVASRARPAFNRDRCLVSEIYRLAASLRAGAMDLRLAGAFRPMIINEVVLLCRPESSCLMPARDRVCAW